MRSSLFTSPKPMLWLALLGLAAPARAEGPKVHVLPYQPIARQASPELCAQVTQVVTSELASGASITMIKNDEAPAEETAPAEGEAAQKPADKDVPGRAALDKALSLAQTGSKHIKKQKFDPAIKVLGEATKQFALAVPAVTDIGPVSQAHLELAVAYWKRGREDEAMAEMATAVRLNPDFKPDPKEYFPLFLRVYDQQWRKTLREARGTIRVDATVPGAEVFFDGRSVGAVPLRLTNVVPGQHFVRVVKEGAGIFGTLVDVAGDQTAELTAELGGTAPQGGGGLGPVAKGINANQIDEGVLSAARELGKEMGADYVIFGGVRQDESTIGVTSFMIHVGEGQVGRLVDLELDTDLLSASVEAFKLVEEVDQRIKEFGDVLPAGVVPLVKGVAGAEESGPSVTEVDVGPAIPEAQGRSGERGPVAAEGGEGGDGKTDARIIGAGEGEGGAKKKVRRTSLTPTKEDKYQPKKPFYASPIFLAALGGVGVVGAAVLVVALAGIGGVGGAAAWYLLSPAQSATVQTEWPK